MKEDTLYQRIEILEQAFGCCAGPCYHVNLSQNIIPGTMYRWINEKKVNVNQEFGLSENTDYTELVSYWSKKLPEKERADYLAFFDIANLLKRYQAGESHVRHRYWTGTAFEKPMLVERHMAMFEDAESGDIMAYSYVRDMTEKYETERNKKELDEEQQMVDVLCQDYVLVFKVNLLEDYGILLKLDPGTHVDEIPHVRKREQIPYTEYMEYYCRHYIESPNQSEFRRKMDAKNLWEKLSTGSRCVYRYKSIPNPAGYQWFEIQIIRISEDAEDGNAMIAFRYIDDVITTEQKRQIELEERLKKEQNQNEMLSAISQIYHSIFRIDLKADTYEEIYCYDQSQHLMKKSGKASVELIDLCNRFVIPEHRKHMRQFFQMETAAERLREEDSVNAECMTMDGNWHQARFIAKRRDENGRAEDILYVTRIISDEKRREERLMSLMEDANEANLAKTEFISQIAHDIRTPMNSMFGFLEIAERNLDDSQKLRYSLEKIRISGEFLKQLVDDVLDMSSMESGKLKLQPEKHSLQKILGEFPVSMEYAKKGKNLKVRYKIHDIVQDCVVVDSLRLKQIYSNVLSNAIKYTPEGGTVEFEAYEEQIPDSDQVQITAVISDTGVGMSEEFMEKMFSKFERETDTRINQVSGYGLGLTIVKQLVDLMNGTIEVNSELGKGTVFRIQLTVPYLPEEQSEIRIPMEQGQTACSGLHLLVAEDNALNREVIAELLALHGISCDCAEDGNICVECLCEAEKDFYDAVLMDMQMPNMDGLMAAKTIRSMKSSWASSIPIIAMTANALNSDVRKCLDAGMNAHLAKPVNIQELVKVLMELIKNPCGKES